VARPVTKISLDPSYFQIVREGMRLCVTEGTCTSINLPGIVDVAAKSGTAQLGVSKDLVNSWIIGFWPYENPKYAFAVVMERASKTNQFGAALVIRQLLQSLSKSNILLQ
jgi:cell division protein FtsI/penicillin-binding protein 2